MDAIRYWDGSESFGGWARARTYSAGREGAVDLRPLQFAGRQGSDLVSHFLGGLRVELLFFFFVLGGGEGVEGRWCLLRFGGFRG